MIQSNNDWPNKHCIPTHSYGQAVCLYPEVHLGLPELNGQFALKKLGEILCDHVFSGTVIEF